MDPFELLGITLDTPIEEIKTIYKKKCMECHPDRDGGSTEVFQQLQIAYEFVINPEKRKMYQDYGTTDIKAMVYIRTATDLIFQLLGNPQVEDPTPVAINHIKNSISNKERSIVNLLNNKEIVDKKRKAIKDSPKNKIINKLIDTKLEAFLSQIKGIQNSIEEEKKVLEVLESIERGEIDVSITPNGILSSSVTTGWGYIQR